MPIGRRIAAGALLAATVALAGGGATTRQADAGLLARPAGTPSRGSVGAADVVDPIGDTGDARADVANAAVWVEGDRLHMRMTVPAFTNPTGDPSWVAGVTGPSWEFDTNVDGSADVWVRLQNIQGTLFGSFYGLPPDQFCPVSRSATAATSTYEASVPVSCLGDVADIGWFATMQYRTFDSTVHQDRVPDVGTVALQLRPDAPGAVAIPPVRLLDTRAAPDGSTIDGSFVGLGRVAAGSVTEVRVAGRGGVDASARAVLLNVTAIDPEAAGYVTVYPCGTSAPHASSLNVVPAAVRSNAAFTGLAADGTACILSSTSTDLAIDVDGFVPGGGAPIPIVPARLLDTRPAAAGTGSTVDGLGVGGGPRPAGSVTVVAAAARGGVDASATGVLLNVTAVDPSAPGFLTAFPCGTTPSPTSNVNYRRGETVSTAAFAALAPGGTVCIATSATTDVVVDVTGFVDQDSLVTPIRPERFADSRTAGRTIDGASSGSGPIPARSAVRIPIAGRGSVPAGASSVMLTVTAVAPDGHGYLAVFPCDQPVPVVSHLTYRPGAVEPAFVLATLDASGAVCVYSLARTDVVLDVAAFVPGNP